MASVSFVGIAPRSRADAYVENPAHAQKRRDLKRSRIKVHEKWHPLPLRFFFFTKYLQEETHPLRSIPWHYHHLVLMSRFTFTQGASFSPEISLLTLSSLKNKADSASTSNQLRVYPNICSDRKFGEGSDYEL